MDFFHSHTKIVKRSKGQSAVACASYRAGLTLYDDRLGVVFNYSGKGGVEYSEIILPTHAPERFRDREALWNEVERKENRKDAQLAREIEFSLPNELQPNEQVIFARQYISDNFVSQGMIADFSFHSGHHRHSQRSRDDQESLFDTPITPDNPHIHVMLTMRDVTPEGFSLKNTAWNERGNVKLWRENLADRINSEYQKRGISDRVDPRKFSEQGIDQEPTIHEGGARELESRGIKTERGEINREIKARNRQRERNREKMNIERPLQVLYDANGEAERRAAGLKAQYTELEQQINRLNIKEQEFIYDARRVASLIREFSDRAVVFDRFEAQINALNAQKDGLSLGKDGFDYFKKQAEIKEQIHKVEMSRNLAAEKLEKDYQIKREQIPDKVRELEEQADEIKRQREAMPDRQELLRQQQSVGDLYQQEMQNHPPEQKEQPKQAERAAHKTDPRQSLSDTIAAIAAEKKLENMARESGQGARQSPATASDQQSHAGAQPEKDAPSKKRSRGIRH